MSTRSNIIVISPTKEIKQYYRHWDGYFEGAGLDLIKKLNDAFSNRYWSKYMKQEELNNKFGGYNPIPVSFYDMFMFEMSKDLRIHGDEKSWAENNYEPEDNLILHGDIEYLYIIDFSIEDGVESARLFYRGLGIGNNFIKKHNRSDLGAVYRHVVDCGRNPLTLRVC